MIFETVKKIFEGKKRESKPRDYEWEKFQSVARQQFRRLKDKGLNIPVFTL